MKLNRAIFALTTLALFAGAAQAQTVGAGSYDIDAVSATVSQTITVTVPKRFGLHLHDSSWVLNLGNVGVDGTYSSTGTNGGSLPSGLTTTSGANDANCVRAGDHSSGSTGTGRDFLYHTGSATDASSKDAKILSLVNGANYEGDQLIDTAGNAYSYTGTLTWPTPSNLRTGTTTLDAPIGGYPGFYVVDSALVWKGPIMCSFQTIVQKFSNSSAGFDFTAQLTAAASPAGNTFPLPLYVRDFIKGPAITGVTTSSAVLTSGATAASRLALGQGVTSGGWLDDHLLQVLVFDGSEVNGSYVGNVTYTLTDTTVPVVVLDPPAPGI